MGLGQADPARTTMTDSALLDAFLFTHPQVRFIHLQWLDYTSTVRTRVFPCGRVREMFAAGQMHSLGGLNMTLIDGSAPLAVDNPSGPVGEPVGQARLRPDMASIRLCPGLEGHASVMCDFESVSVNADEAALSSAEIGAFCPRRALQRSVARAAQMGLGFLVGFEIEFACTPQDGFAAGQAVVQQTSGLRTLEAYMLPVLCRLSEELAKSGMPILHFHAESEENQFEIATAPLPPLEAVDAFIATREAIRRVCRSHGINVSFHPWNPAQNGVHLNLSLHSAAKSGRRNSDWVADGGTGDSFLAGLLHHLDSLFAIGLPYSDCYQRTRPGYCGTGCYKAWGTQNRELPIRKKGEGFWELRFADAATQTYLFLAALIAAGLDGVERRITLQLADCRGKRPF
jgi:glutamine synthetase